MQTLKVNKKSLLPVINIPTSKSYANRGLILASLSEKEVVLENLPPAEDVVHLRNALVKVGLKIESDNNKVTVKNSFPECETGDVELEVGEGGTTGRFLACMLLLGKKTYRLKLGKRLAQRPWQDFVKAATTHGAYVELYESVLTIKGPMRFPDFLEVNCSETTQFATGFLLTSMRSNTKVVPSQLESSQSYWDMTQQMIHDFPQKNRFVVPKDWSSASYSLAFAALNQEIYFPGLFNDELQADAKFLGLLESLGSIKTELQGLRAMPYKHARSVTLNVSDCLDLVPTLGYFLAHIPGKHTLTGLKNLVHKESDRLHEVVKLIQVFGRQVEASQDQMTIHGSTERVLSRPDLKLPYDHRMVMAATLFLLHHNGGTVTPMDAVKKSYPDFFQIISG